MLLVVRAKRHERDYELDEVICEPLLGRASVQLMSFPILHGCHGPIVCNAPIPAVRGTAIEPPESTLSGHSATTEAQRRLSGPVSCANLPSRVACATLLHKKTEVQLTRLLWREEMLTSAVSGNRFSKVVFGLTAGLLVFAPLTARAAGPEKVFDFQLCNGYFALCAASTCTPTGKQIAVNTPTGGTRNFPEADCTCPVILGPSLANLAGGNMQGSCDPPGPG